MAKKTKNKQINYMKRSLIAGALTVVLIGSGMYAYLKSVREAPVVDEITSAPRPLTVIREWNFEGGVGGWQALRLKESKLMTQMSGAWTIQGSVGSSTYLTAEQKIDARGLKQNLYLTMTYIAQPGLVVTKPNIQIPPLETADKVAVTPVPVYKSLPEDLQMKVGVYTTIVRSNQYGKRVQVQNLLYSTTVAAKANKTSQRIEFVIPREKVNAGITEIRIWPVTDPQYFLDALIVEQITLGTYDPNTGKEANAARTELIGTARQLGGVYTLVTTTGKSYKMVTPEDLAYEKTCTPKAVKCVRAPCPVVLDCPSPRPIATAPEVFGEMVGKLVAVEGLASEIQKARPGTNYVGPEVVVEAIRAL